MTDFYSNLISNNVDITFNEYSELSEEEVYNLSLLYEFEISEKIMFENLKIPEIFDFSEENILNHFPQLRDMNRNELVAFYLKKGIANKSTHSFGKKILLIGIKVLLGMRLNDLETLPDDLPCSDPIKLMVIIYKLIRICELMKKPVMFNKMELLDFFVLHRSADEMWKIENTCKFFSEFVFSDDTFTLYLNQFERDPDLEEVVHLVGSLCRSERILEEYLVEKLEVVACSKRDKMRSKALRDKAVSMMDYPFMHSKVDMIWNLPVQLGKQGVESNNLSWIESYFNFKKMGKEFLKDGTKFVGSQIVRAGLNQWLDLDRINPSLVSAKGTELWWKKFRESSLKICFRDEIVSHLFYFLIRNHFSSMQVVDTKQVLSVLWSFEFDLERLANESRFYGLDVDEKELIILLQKILKNDQYMHKNLELIRIRDLIKEILRPNQNALVSILKLKKREYFNSTIEYKELTNLYHLGELLYEPARIFEKMFIVNSSCFMETDKIQKLTTFLNLDKTRYAHVLHYAGMAYCDNGEIEGAKSVLKRLVEEYKYPDAWRLAHRLGECRVGALELCHDENLADVVEMMAEPGSKHVARDKHIPGNEYINSFPNLSNREQVNKYMHLIGAADITEKTFSYELAEFISRIPSMTDGKSEKIIKGLHKAAMLVN